MAQRTRPDDAKNRALLFGSAHQRRPTVAPPPAPGVIAASERETLETANDGAVDGLRGRVGEMRHLAIDLGAEVRDQNAMLDGMGGTFDSAGTSLKRTIAEVGRLASSGSGGQMCALFLFAFIFFFLVWLLLR